MEFLKQIFHDQNKVFVSLLQNQGFSVDQANDFIYEVACSLSTSNPDMDIPLAIKQLISDEPAQILHSIDSKSLAKKLGLSSGIVESGIKTIQADLSYFMSLKKDDILNTIISLSWGSNGQPLPLVKHIFN